MKPVSIIYYLLQELFNGLEENTILNRRSFIYGYTPLHDSVYSNKPEVVHYLASKRADVNAKTQLGGYTPLHLAASSGYVECTSALLKYGAYIDVTDKYGKTPKQTAIKSSKPLVARLLRSEGK